jgi:hypothetical protein
MRRPQRAQVSDPARRRLFLLATALVTRGVQPEEAYIMAFNYVYGRGHGQTWISALAELDIKRPHDLAVTHD